MNKFGEKGAWAYQGTAQIFGVPSIISGTGKATNFKFGQYIQVPSEQTPIKIWQKRERGCIQGLPNFFRVPLLSQEQVKLRTSKFACTFMGSIGTKAH